jgi:hypothetical protein
MQEVPVPAAPMPAWGIDLGDANWLKLGSGSFTPIRSEYTYDTPGNGFRYSTTGSTSWYDSSFHVPTGTKINRFTAEAYDNDAVADVWVWFVTCPNLSAGCTYTADTHTSGQPGYTWLDVNLPSPITIDNDHNNYHVRVRVAGSNNTQFRHVAFRYQFQVSPAPGVATFNDVPTSHQYFQFIEALKASGITTGCQVSPPLYCPDNPVTRGQMAVFLARALGLHWPN